MSDSDRKDSGTLVRLTEQDLARAAELEAFVKREFELKRTMTFGEWIRHVKDSHEQLLHLVAAAPVVPSPLRVDVLRHNKDGSSTITTYELPCDARRVIVDVDEVFGTVWAFRQTSDPTQHKQVNGQLVAHKACVLVCGPPQSEG
jgi:hypothetical protein